MRISQYQHIAKRSVILTKFAFYYIYSSNIETLKNRLLFSNPSSDIFKGINSIFYIGSFCASLRGNTFYKQWN